MKKFLCVVLLSSLLWPRVMSGEIGFEGSSGRRLSLHVQSGYLPGLPILVRAELRNSDGSFARDIWDATAFLSVDQPEVVLSTNRILLRNGLGSALVVPENATGDFTLTATVDSLQTRKVIRSLTNAPMATVSGALPGSDTRWSNVVHITADVTVPDGHTLTIAPGTMVLLNGVTSGSSAPDLLVNGAIRSLGTAEDPVVITCHSPNLAVRWGQIRHNNAEPSRYEHTTITRGGRCPGEGHTGQGPVFRPTNSRVHFEHCNLTDYATAAGTPGKIMHATGSELSLNECLLQRARMGPEISGSSFLCTNTWILDMKGPDDSDGVYPHSQGAGQEIRFVGCVFANGDDDGIDTLGSSVTVDDCIIRDWANPREDAKGISGFNGTIRVRRCLFANCFVGLSTKSSSASPARVFIEQCTILGITNGVLAAWKSNATNGVIDIRITNSIVLAPRAIQSDFGPTNFAIGYCDLSQPWPGTGNITTDPTFVNGEANDYRLQPGSPCIDAGSPATPPDGDGSPADIGFFTFIPPPPTLMSPNSELDGTFSFGLSAYTNRNYRVEMSTNLTEWTSLLTVWMTNPLSRVNAPPGAGGMRGFYRARLASPEPD